MARQQGLCMLSLISILWLHRRHFVFSLVLPVCGRFDCIIVLFGVEKELGTCGKVTCRSWTTANVIRFIWSDWWSLAAVFPVFTCAAAGVPDNSQDDPAAMGQLFTPCLWQFGTAVTYGSLYEEGYIWCSSSGCLWISMPEYWHRFPLQASAGLFLP